MATGFTEVGSELIVNSYTTASQYQPAVAGLDDGGYVIVWASNGQDLDGFGIYGQRYDDAGNLDGSEFHVSVETDGNQLNAQVSGLVGGGFVVTWTSDGQDGDGYGVFAQVYDSSGAVTVSEFQVNTHTDDLQSAAQVTGLADGSFVITWHSYLQINSTYEIYSRYYDDTGSAVGGEVLVNTVTASYQYDPVITALDDGGYIIVWDSLQDGSAYGVYGQRYDNTGTPSGSEFLINTTTANFQELADVATLADGGFIVTWEDNIADGSGEGIFAQRYNAAGATVGSEFPVNTFITGDQYAPHVTGMADGGFVIIWSSEAQDGDQLGVYGQRYDANGDTVGIEMRINTTTASVQSQPDIATLADGGFVVTWSSYPQDGNHNATVAQQYAAELWGTSDDDTIIDTDGANWLNGQAGKDVLKGSGGKDYIYGGDGGDTLHGGAKRDKLFGEAGKDNLIGGTGNDVLKGKNGADTLLGGADKDTMTGGNGDDIFIYEDVSESTNDSNADVIKDFAQGEDLIDLAALGTLSFIGSANFNGTGAAEFRVANVGGDTVLRVDIDGDGTTDMKVNVNGINDMLITDFIL